MKIGTCLPHETGQLENGGSASGQEVLDIARLAENIGFDSVWLVDHLCYEPYLDQYALGVDIPESRKGERIGAWECCTIAAALAVATERVEIGTLVINTGFRNPALLARMMETVDELSGGRLILGLGAGDFSSEHDFFGYPFERRIGRFEEALQIIVPMLRGERVTFEGEFYQTKTANLIPKGPRAKGAPILIGLLKGGPRMKRLVMQYADQWSCWLASTDSHAPSYLPSRDAMSAACEKHGRDPDTLQRNVTVRCIPPGATPAHGATPLCGSPQQIADEIHRFSELGVDHVTIWPEPNTAKHLELLAPVVEALKS